MCNETCTVTIADIYGAEWWSRNKAELDREWEWGFRLAQDSERYAIRLTDGIVENKMGSGCLPRIILHRRKPKPPTLRDVYGTDEVKIPVGWEWTGEWRVPVIDTDWGLADGGKQVMRWPMYGVPATPRLILRERPKKVWFKAEETERHPRSGDWIWQSGGWGQVNCDWHAGIRLCATRHEEIDSTVQVVTQSDIDALTQPSK